MDEIIIEEKKYISSKRAAEITGYAKDYVGQLCREGRVPARLIGRGWYVLEAAIQDHRFGNPEAPEVPEAAEPEKTIEWEAPRYEASNEPEMSQNIQDSWREWFNRFDHKEEVVEPKKAETEVETETEIEREGQEEPVNVPIHAIYRPLPVELLPNRSVIQLQDSREVNRNNIEKKRSGTLEKVIQTVGILLASIAVVIAVIGIGYFDKYILSVSPVNIIAGVSLYNK